MNNRKLMISVTSSLFILLITTIVLFAGSPLPHLSAQTMFTLTAQPMTIEAIVNQLFMQTAEAPQHVAMTQTIGAAFDHALTGTAIASSGSATRTSSSTGGLFSQPASVQTQTALDLAELHAALDRLIPQWESSVQANQERHVSSAEAGMPNDNNIKDVVYGKCGTDFFVLVVDKGTPTNAGIANGSGYEYSTATSPSICHPPEYEITDWENDGGGWWFVYIKSDQPISTTLSPTVLTATALSPYPTNQWQPAPASGPLSTRTPVIPTGPTLEHNNEKIAVDILNNLPKHIQNFTLEADPKKTFIGKDQSGTIVGIVGVYALNRDNKSELYVSIWIAPTENDAEDRYLLQYHKMNDIYGFPTTPGEVGDESFVAPEAKPVRQDTGFINAPVWGSARFRNVEFDFYPTKNLTDALPDFNIFDALEIQSMIFDALQSVSTNLPTSTTTIESSPAQTVTATQTPLPLPLLLTATAFQSTLNALTPTAMVTTTTTPSPIITAVLGDGTQRVTKPAISATPIALPGGLQYIDTVIGTGVAAQDGDTLTVKYVGKFTNGTVFDSSDSHGEPFSFQLGTGQVIEGWDEGLVGMKVGGKRTLTIPPSLAYGTQGVGTIPPNTTLIFDVELIAIK